MSKRERVWGMLGVALLVLACVMTLFILANGRW